MKQGPTALVILDGFGYSKQKEHNAIARAHTPHLAPWFKEYPHTLLAASGSAVGLPEGYIGNSEVGHLTIGAGRVIEQPLTRIFKDIADRTFFNNPALVAYLEQLRKSGDALHLMGLLSAAGVHSSLELLYALLDAAHQHGIKQVYIHAFLDGRDMPPRSAQPLLAQLEEALTTFEFGSIGSLHGRLYAMDRDGNWERTERSYRALTSELTGIAKSWEAILERNYAQGITDEFIEPVLVDPTATLRPGDGVIFFNIRPDRARQLAAAFVDPRFAHFPVQKLPLSFFMTPVDFGAELATTVLYPRELVNNTLKEIVSAHGFTIFSIAETEKYAHVTYFFNGGQEEAFAHEKTVLIPSLKEKTYVDHPCMSAVEITDAVVQSLRNAPADFYLINYANADMVGHSGNMQATIKAIECLDAQLARLCAIIVEELQGTLYVTADHGKAEDMFDEHIQQPRTAHTANPVPFIMLKKGLPANMPLPLQGLADIAPFIVEQMGIKK